MQIERDDGVFQLAVERVRLFGVVGAVFDGPAGDVLDAALDPPAVQNGEAGHAVQRGLHAAGAGGLVGAPGRVDPDIDARGEQRAEIPVVVLEIDDAQHVVGELVRPSSMTLMDERLAGLVLRMRLAGVENLQAAGLAWQSLSSRSGSVKSRLARL